MPATKKKIIIANKKKTKAIPRRPVIPPVKITDLPTAFPTEDAIAIYEAPPKIENQGGKVNYYKVFVERPNQLSGPYHAECSDIIEALGMDFNEGEAFKALWRRAAQRKFGIGREGNTAFRDAQKIEHFGNRLLILEGL